jgi:hypothetical protein
MLENVKIVNGVCGPAQACPAMRVCTSRANFRVVTSIAPGASYFHRIN